MRNLRRFYIHIVALILVFDLCGCAAMTAAAEPVAHEVVVQFRRWHGLPAQWFLTDGVLTVAFAESECSYGGFLAYQLAAYANAGMLDFSQFANAGRWHGEVSSRCRGMAQELKEAVTPAVDFAPPVPFFLRPYISGYCSQLARGGNLP